MSLTRKATLYALRLPVAAAIVAGAIACIVQRPAVKQLDPHAAAMTVRSPVKAHLVDGSTIVYRDGASLIGSFLTGNGVRYPIGASTGVLSSSISVDSIVGMETFSNEVATGTSVAMSIGGAAIGALVGAVAAIAIFGSCPTIYADSAGNELLQAEGFSYAIAPLFEQRDVDHLRLTPTPDGRVVLRVKNEALETHYINHLELIEVTHAADESALPDGTGHPLAIGKSRISASIHDRAGRDISRVLASPDNDVFSTAEARVASVTAADLDDYIDISIPAPRHADSVAVVLDLRNSLLNTVLLYDHILGAPGLKSLDFLGKDLERIANAVDMGKWYAANMGMRVSVRDGNSYRHVARLGDSGPIAYHRMAVLVPAVKGSNDSIHVRLSFVADDWRIDEISVADSWRRPASRTIAPSSLTLPESSQNATARIAVGEPDESYLITTPGQTFSVTFDVGQAMNESRTWFVVTQGYYTEWVRGSWIKHATGKPFTPSNEALVEAIHSWKTKQSEMEKHFYSQRIATR